ncbi:hypothetical protein NHF50_13480 [Flavobacterium sp. NRK F10]|uniref:DUF3108 domain-containing protein n=1 Tax=Flavobacterium sp. NRK F10 TaxID=2954931 RepID=UPI002091D083|nr:hypothetical protein [Flavobacterium sp. NRK F10]MCO6176057.1 hypothetical protein [Flavobacterium sp. NRK F10]
MKKTIFSLILSMGIVLFSFGQAPLSPQNNPVDYSLVKNESSKMKWFVLQDTMKIEIGTIQTDVQKKGNELIVISTIDLNRSPVKWVDSTIVKTDRFKPVYHSSYNQQRDMALHFKEEITGYYLDKMNNKKVMISEKADQSYFDSNFYPQLIRWLPLKEGYSGIISIFDYNPVAKIGVITATITQVKDSTLLSHGLPKETWIVTTTDDISDNEVVSTYYIEKSSRKVLKQEIDIKGKKMLMELID